MYISMIVAAAENDAIGLNNKLLWHLPNDLKLFKNTTWALPVIMGRKTLESLSGKPLKGRMNIVLTRQKDFTAEGFHVAHDLEQALNLAKDANYLEVNIIGGGEIYREFLPLAQRIFLTRVKVEPEADSFFPHLPKEEWKIVADDPMSPDKRHAYAYRFQVWERVK